MRSVLVFVARDRGVLKAVLACALCMWSPGQLHALDPLNSMFGTEYRPLPEKSREQSLADEHARRIPRLV